MSKYKVSYTPTFGVPTVTDVIEADSTEEAKLKIPKCYDDLYIWSVKKIESETGMKRKIQILLHKKDTILGYRFFPRVETHGLNILSCYKNSIKIDMGGQDVYLEFDILSESLLKSVFIGLENQL